MNKIQQQLVQLIAKYAEVNPDTLGPDTLIKDSGIDSLGIVELIFDIEESYDISVDLGGDIKSRLDFGTIADMAELLEEATQKAIA